MSQNDLNKEQIKCRDDNYQNVLLVKDVLEMPMFKGSAVIGGNQGISKQCKHMCILDTPEGIEWLRGGEFILSTGYIFKDGIDVLKNVIYRASRKNVSAIAIKEKRYIETIPQEMIDQANQYGIPLIIFPYNLIFTETITSFYDTLLYKKNEYIYQAKDMHERFLKLMLESKDIQEVVNVLSEITGSSIALLDSVSNLVSQRLYDRHEKILNEAINDNEKLENIHEKLEEVDTIKCDNYYISVYKIMSKNEFIGYMHIVSDAILNSLNMEALEHGRRILACKMEKEGDNQLNIIKINKSITNIILNSENISNEFYTNIINNYKWNDKERFIGICIEIYSESLDNKNVDIFNGQICNLIGRIFREEGFFISGSANKVFLFFCIDDRSISDIIYKICKFTSNYSERIEVSFSISRIYNRIKYLTKMYNECCITSRFNKKGETLYYDSLDTIKLLYSLNGDVQVLEHCEKTIGKLEEYDIKNNSELVKTMDIYFKYDMNKKLVSEKLFIHIETLRYRLNKIESLTGYSLNSSEGIFALQMGTKLYNIIKLGIGK